jgi:hypothetical protein
MPNLTMNFSSYGTKIPQFIIRIEKIIKKLMDVKSHISSLLGETMLYK